MASNSKVGRNDPCPCGSGKKYKNCCEGKRGRLTPVQWGGIGLLAVVAGILVYVMLTSTGSAGGLSGARSCPAGQVWSAQHGHCH